MSRPASVRVWFGLGVLLLGTIAARLLLDATGLGWPDHDHAWFAVTDRFHRLVLASLVGVALAISGVCLQALLRNPLAEPYILGLSTGAGLGMLLQRFVLIQLGMFAAAPGWVGALIGAGLTLVIVFTASRRNGVIDRLGLLLVGVVLSTINGALIMLLNYLAGPGLTRDTLVNWMMGVLPPRPLNELDLIVGLLSAVVFVVLLWHARSIDLATLDDDEAAAMGLRVNRLKALLLLTASVLTASAVVIAGPIAFVGLIAPHLARLLLGPSHRPLLIGSAMLGAVLLVAADTASEWLAYLAPSLGRMPVGIFTAAIGGPVFLWLLRPQLGRGIE